MATKISPETTVGPVSLTVADLDRSIGWYEHALGLEVAERSATLARLEGGGTPLLELHEEAGARPVRGHTGLYHYAVLVPDRLELARWLRHIAENRIPLTGLSDHLVSEAIYLSDPDGHGIEVYRDRPRSEWSRGPDGKVALAVDPLDPDSVLGELDGEDVPPFERMPPGTTMGHVHLHVRDVGETERFYSGVLGFDVMAQLGNQATFLAAGGYHHHLGANIWAGHGAAPPPPGSAALRHATIVLGDAAERDRLAGAVSDSGGEVTAIDGDVMVRDPSQNALVLTTR